MISASHLAWAAETIERQSERGPVRVDLVISMRFHATIFALAQERRVIGIDYRIGKRDKVASLLSDFDQSVNCTRIDELTADWLFERLRALAASLPCGRGQSAETA